MLLHYYDLIPRFFLRLTAAASPASAADAAAVNLKVIKTLLANGLITFFINGSPIFSNGPCNLPKKSSWLYHL